MRLRVMYDILYKAGRMKSYVKRLVWCDVLWPHPCIQWGLLCRRIFLLCLPLIFEGNVTLLSILFQYLDLNQLFFPIERMTFLGWAASWPIMRSRKSPEHWKKCVFMPIILHTEQFNSYFLSICNILSSEIAFLGLFYRAVRMKTSVFEDTLTVSRCTSTKAHPARCLADVSRKCGVRV